jgi:hypothetical protein
MQVKNMSEVNKVKINDEKKVCSLSRSITWFFLAGSILVLIYTYYRAEVNHLGAQPERYFKYYVIAILGVLFWGVVLWLREEVRVNILTVTIALIIGLYMAEGALHFFSLSRVAEATKLGIEFDRRTRLEVIKSLKAEGLDAVPPVFAQHLIDQGGMLQDGNQLHTLGGISKKTTVGKNEGGKRSIYQSDRYGFNNPDSEWDSTNVNWLMVGDSFTRGSAVQVGEEIAGQIRYLTNSTVINLGMSGNGPLTELATLTEYAKSLHPRKVLWVYYDGNDIDNMHHEKSAPILMQYLEDNFSQHLMDRQEEIDRRLKELIDKNIRPLLKKTEWMRLYKLRKKIKIIIGPDGPAKAHAKIDPLFAEILTKAKERTEAWGGELYFVYLTQTHDLTHFLYFTEPVDSDLYRKKTEVIEFVKGLSIPVIDIQHEVFSDHPDPLALFPLRMIAGHYNAEGYSEIAKAIVSSIGN